MHLFAIRRQIALAALLLATPAYAQAPPSIIVTQVAEQNIAPAFSNIGHVVAIQSVKIVPRVVALINAVNFEQGSDVKTGQVLFTLQPQQYQAALQTAQANLASAQAALENAESVYARAADLRQSGFEAESSLDSASAIRNEDRSNVLSAEAGVTNAALNLSYCTITAPIDGRIGAVALTKGNLVTATTGTLATINQLDPIRVVFSVSTDSPILTAAQDDPSESQFAISLDLPNGKPYPITGRIAFLDNQVDSNTGTVNVYADFANPNGALLPGAYVNVATAAASAQQALLIPVAAVQTDQSSSFVLTVGPENKVAKQTVILGEQIAQNYVVKSGITLGERVIVDGIQKVKIGQIVNPAVAPSDISSSDNSAATVSQ